MALRARHWSGAPRGSDRVHGERSLNAGDQREHLIAKPIAKFRRRGTTKGIVCRPGVVASTAVVGDAAGDGQGAAGEVDGQRVVDAAGHPGDHTLDVRAKATLRRTAPVSASSRRSCAPAWRRTRWLAAWMLERAVKRSGVRETGSDRRRGGDNIPATAIAGVSVARGTSRQRRFIGGTPGPSQLRSGLPTQHPVLQGEPPVAREPRRIANSGALQAGQ